jgi:exoribonuclease-2
MARHDRSDLRTLARDAMRARGLDPDIPREAEEQAASIAGPASGDGLPDLRALPWCSIDNDDSRDLDQLTVAVEDAGATRLLVAVADVDALVPRGTPVDAHAALNTTSVYTPAAVFPMLPLRLSTDLTSLNEGEDRAALVIDMTVEQDGSFSSQSVHRAFVHNHAQLAYPSVGAWLEDRGPIPQEIPRVDGLEANLRLQDSLTRALSRRRHDDGALELESIEPRAVFDGEALKDLRVEPKNRARQLIEDSMIAANGVTTRFLVASGFPTLRRVVREPERWLRIVKVAEEHGHALPGTPDPLALSRFLSLMRLEDPLRFPDLSLVVVKLMGAGEYAVQRPGRPPLGHFGLAVRDYSHSTAPNRRFPDLVTHRLVKAALRGEEPPYTIEELEHLAEHCTDQEDDVSRIERQLRKSAAVLVLQDRVGERFDGIVTGASEKGTWVRVLRPPVEGKVVRGARGLEVGSRVAVKLLATDFSAGYIDFARA